MDKPNNLSFILLFYLNIFKNFIAIIIFIILVQNINFNLSINFFLMLTLILTLLILWNFYTAGFFSRIYYPFTNRTTGYNLIGLISGLIFFTTYSFSDKNDMDKKKLYIILLINFLILFFCFSKTAIISFLSVLVFYFFLNIKKINKRNVYLLFILIITLFFALDFTKFFLERNVFSFFDIILNPLSWFYEYGSFYYRIEHVWLSNIDENLKILIFLFGEGVYSPKTHDSLYFTLISRFGFLGLGIFLLTILNIFSNIGITKHNSLSYILIFGITTEMILQSNIINPLALILLYINCSEKINLK